jgi:nucleoid-associated protein YgaU
MPVTLYSRYYGRENVEIGDVLSLSQQPPVEVQEFPDSLRHTVIGGETLDQLAKRYYGREDLWWRIADANASRFPMDWKPGDVLVIPPIRVATRMPRR